MTRVLLSIERLVKMSEGTCICKGKYQNEYPSPRYIYKSISFYFSYFYVFFLFYLVMTATIIYVGFAVSYWWQNCSSWRLTNESSALTIRWAKIQLQGGSSLDQKRFAFLTVDSVFLLLQLQNYFISFLTNWKLEPTQFAINASIFFFKESVCSEAYAINGYTYLRVILNICYFLVIFCCSNWLLSCTPLLFSF